MILNLHREFSPEHVLDILPENDEDANLIKDFLGNFASQEDFTRIVIAPIKGGLCITVE